MSKPTLLGIVVACLVAGVLIGLYVVPGMQIGHAERDVGGAATRPTPNTAPQPAPNTAPQPAPNTAPQPAPVGAPIAIEREAFAMTLPQGSTVDPEAASVGSERLVTASVPGHGTISIVVADNKEQAGAAFEHLLASFRGKVDNAEEQKPAAFDSMRLVRATGVRGSVKGEGFRFEIGQCEGWDKECVIVLEYPEENKGEVVPMMAEALGTFRMKQ